MLKILLKKQLYELNYTFFQNKKTGKRKSKSGIVSAIVLFAVLMLVVAGIFAGVSAMMGDALISMGLDWLYFAMMGMLAILLGTFGSVFNTFASLYQAKDNEFLLSLPIKPNYILIVRISGVAVMSLLYSGIAWVPACIVYWLMKGNPGLTVVIYDLLLTIVLAIFVTVISCILGWIVALISTRLKKKNIITVIVSLAFFLGYYYVCFRINNLINEMIQNIDVISDVVKGWLWPIYQLGMAASGKTMAMLIFTLIAAVLFTICFMVLSKTYTGILTMNKGVKKVEYKEKSVKTTSFSKALFNKELKRFTSSSTYMLNSGLGMIFMLVVAILAVVKMDVIRSTMSQYGMLIPGIDKVLPVFIAVSVAILISMNGTTAPSISLEGKSIWILQSLPVDAWDVLKAKEKLHIYLNAIPAAIFVIVLGFVCQASWVMILLDLIFGFVYLIFTADFGLILNLNKPNLDWTNESVPVKQSICVVIYLFGGWIFAMIIAAGGFLLMNVVRAELYMAVVIVIFAVVVVLLRKWLKNKGAAIFSSL